MAGHSESHVHPVSLYTRTLWWLMALLVLTGCCGVYPECAELAGRGDCAHDCRLEGNDRDYELYACAFQRQVSVAVCGRGLLLAADYARVRLRRLCEPPVGAVPRLVGVISVFALVFQHAPLPTSPVDGGGVTAPSPLAGRVGVGAMFKSHCKDAYQSLSQSSQKYGLTRNPSLRFPLHAGGTE
jgi:hypothetical protein